MYKIGQSLFQQHYPPLLNIYDIKFYPAMEQKQFLNESLCINQLPDFFIHTISFVNSLYALIFSFVYSYQFA